MLTSTDPVQELRKEHNDLLTWLDVLDIILSWLTRSSPTMSQMQMLVDLLAINIPRHSHNEQDGLFPELLAREEFHPGWRAILGQIAELQQDLTELRAAWERFKDIPEDNLPATRAELLARCEKLLKDLREHVYEEESLLLPYAHRKLSPDQKATAAHRMEELALPLHPAGELL